jgi:3-hydroxyisobutyrate dehydrogenase-like beta-hydroxyacid dehydrogenase
MIQEFEMSEVTVIGLGPMGQALTRALVVSGQRVTVWNRTAAKADQLVRDGAILAPSAAAAIAASAVTVVCVHDYTVAQQMLDDAAEPLAGRVLIQLSTGTPQDARDSELWAHAQGADYLDGAILATPTQVGRPDTPLFLSGSETALARADAALNAIAGTRIYLGDAVGHAAAWDLATLSCLFGALLGFVHGARICETEGLAVGDLGVRPAGAGGRNRRCLPGVRRWSVRSRAGGGLCAGAACSDRQGAARFLCGQGCGLLSSLWM